MSEWKIRRIKDYFKVYAGATPSSKVPTFWDGEITWVTPADMSDFGEISESQTTITQSGYNSCGTTLVPPGSIILSSRAPIGKVNIATEQICTNQGCKSLVPKKINPKFIAYYLYTTKNDIDTLGQGTTFKELPLKRLVAYNIPVPDDAIQSRIVFYLDSKNAAIDKKVTLLTEKRDAYLRLKKSIINRAVTKGLNPNVKMKDSGVEWIGEIPEGWKVSRFKDNFKNYTTGITPDSKNDSYFEIEKGETWITIADMNSKIVNSSNMNLSDIAIDKFQPAITQKGSLLFSFKLSIGKLSFAGKELYTNEAIVSIPPSPKIELSYFYYYLPMVLEEHATENIYGAKMLNQKIIANMIMAIPPITEQQAITSYLDDKCSKIDAIVSNINTQIEKYKLLKRALINEVVTGKRAV